MAKQVIKNVTLNGHRTSLRLEQDIWDALHEICQKENFTLNQLGSMINEVRKGSSMAAAIRVFVLMYFRTLAKEQNHVKRDHSILGRMDCGNLVRP